MQDRGGLRGDQRLVAVQGVFDSVPIADDGVRLSNSAVDSRDTGFEHPVDT